MANIIYYSQRDPRWANVKIGTTNLRLGDWGCLISDVCTLLSWAGITITPAQLARYPGLFNKNGELIWANLPAATKGKIKLTRRLGGKTAAGRIVWVRDDKAIKTSILNSPNTVVIVQVNNGKHWVAGLGVTPDGKDYWIADPIDGKRKQLSKAYPNITGSAHLLLT
jgi:hypothetical protein